MYLQLAENENMEYIPVETNQGTILVRPDLLNEDGTMLSAKGRGLKIAAKVVGAAGKFIPLPGAAVASGIATKILDKAAQAKAGGGSAIIAGAQAGKAAGIATKLKGAIAKFKAKGAAPEQVAIPEAVQVRTAAPIVVDTEQTQPQQSFFKRNQKLILIGGGVLVAGAAIYLLTKKKKR
jgi:hypothetical protein